MRNRVATSGVSGLSLVTIARGVIQSAKAFFALPHSRRQPSGLSLGINRRASSIAILTLTTTLATVIAQPVVISAPTTIGPNDTTINGVPLVTAQITVQGTTLTINGRHDIASLVIQRNNSNQSGVLTHTPGFFFDYSGGAGTDVVEGCSLTITGDLFVESSAGGAASRIDVNACGFASDTGPGTGIAGINWGGGGGHGGAGGPGRGDDSYALGGHCYDSLQQPIRLGSGGAFDINTGDSGGAGGGRMKLIVGGTLTNGGGIFARGQDGTGSEAGGGSGGSLWITAGTVAGNGLFQAYGGSGRSAGGSGGGGRIAIYYGSFTGSGTLDSHCNAQGNSGGSGYNGGAGTIFLKQGSSRPTIFVDNFNVIGVITEFEGPSAFDASMVVRKAAKLGPKSNENNGLDLTILGDLSIDATSLVDANLCGFPTDQGPGAGTPGNHWGGGAGHGGAGGDGRGDDLYALGGDCYDSVLQPTMAGSGGASDLDSIAAGGAGGGAVRLIVNGTLTNSGIVRANAQDGTGAEAGGGSGGSLWITAGTVAGNGLFQAYGGSGRSAGGSGGGGRIAIYCGSFTGTGTLDLHCNAQGNSGGSGYNGGAGTIYIKQGSARAGIYIDNANVNGDVTEFYGPTTFDANMVVRKYGKIGSKHALRNDFDLTILGDLSIDATSLVDANLCGFPTDQGPGMGTSGVSWGGGAGHGGAGGDGRGDDLYALGGDCYDSVLQPTMAGSGGASDLDSIAAGGAGGGAVRLIVNGTLTNSGIVRANAQDGTGAEAGGGSGGSLWITAGTVAGNGLFQAYGGSGRSAGGSGGGGRIAIYCGSFTGTGTLDLHCNAQGNSGGSGYNGGAGTIYIKQGSARAGIYIDNANVNGDVTEFYGPTTFDANMVVRKYGKIGSKQYGGSAFDLTLLGDLAINANCAIAADACGFRANNGPGAGHTGVNWGGGGGYGGRGGNGRSDDAGATGGGIYGNSSNPTDLGSGGGSDPSGAFGGFGGGAIGLHVSGAFTLDGYVLARGGGAAAQEAGGGSGGSILINSAALSGVGQILADGGSASSIGGGGGGGRIAIGACTLSLPLANIHANGGGSSGGQSGALGTVVFTGGLQITVQPGDVTTCPTGSATFVVASSGTGYQWQAESPVGSGTWANLIDGTTAQYGTVSGSASTTLQIHNFGTNSATQYRCIVSNACGSIASNGALLTICPADFNCDGFTTGEDFDNFVQAFEAGDFLSDFDGDGFVTGADFDAYVQAFETGC